MKFLAQLILATLLWCGVAQAQQAPDSHPGCNYNSGTFTLSTGQSVTLQCDANGKLIVTGNVTIDNATSIPIYVTVTPVAVAMSSGSYVSAVASAQNNGCLIYNGGVADMLVGWGASPTDSQTIPLHPGAFFTCNLNAFDYPLQQVSLKGTTGDSAVVWTW